MPRQARYFIPHIPQHVIARGVDRQAVFFDVKDYTLYRQALLKASNEYGCQVHAYVLMTNHVHLLVTPESECALPLVMQAMGRLYVQRLNARYQRSGPLWEGRYRASPVQTNRYLMACQRYIELNPVRAGLVAAPGDYPYSSYRHHAFGVADALLNPHQNYFALDANPDARRRAYRALFQDVLSDELLTQFRNNTNACNCIGDDRFRRHVAHLLGRSVPPRKMGRPRKDQ